MSIVERSAVKKRSIVDTAKSAVGKIKYAFGADAITDNGTGKADCSAFTKWVLSQNGITVGRTTEEQWTSESGVEVDKDKLQAGDVVFFKNTYNSGYKDGVSHVGIYVGNGEFVHNSTSKGVTTSKLDSSYYSERYLGAKRFTVSNLNFEDEKEESDGDIELKWWGDLMVVICVVALVVIALVFFIKAFGLDKKVMKGVKNLI